MHTGVWLSNEPLDGNEGAKGDTVLAIEIPEDLLAEYEWVEEGKPYREFMVPAEIVNRYGPPRIHDHDWAGHSRKDILGAATAEAQCEADQGKHEADRLRETVLPFLERHGLLAEEDETP